MFIPRPLIAFSSALLAVAALAPSAFADIEVEEWAHELSDLPADTNVSWGKFDNGLRYAVLPNAEPPGRVSVRLFIDAGSLMEDDDQQGLAHFLEHMAFNGTENFPAGEMVEYFQRLGMAFGADTNAHTGFDETVYKLELPDSSEPLLRDSMNLFRDYAGGMLLLQEEIDDERGIILSEKRSRDSAGYRTMVEGFKFSLPGSRVCERLPIGIVEVIEGAQRDRFADFYNRWYTTDRMAIVVVGDVEPGKVVPLIDEYFSDLEPPAERADAPAAGTVTQGRGVAFHLQTEMEMPYTSIGVEVNKPYTPVPDTAAERRKNLVRGIADQIVSRRFDVLTKAEGSAILQGGASNGDFLDFVQSSEARIICNPDKWEGAIAVAEQEIRRAVEHGFTAAEFAEATANILNSYQNAAEEASTRKSRALADRLVSAISGDDVFTHPGADLPRVEAALGSITVEECHEAFREGWSGGDTLIFVGGNLELDDGAAALEAAWKKSGEVIVEPPAEEEVVPFAYGPGSFGEPGEIVMRRDYALGVERLVARQLRFANNVRVTLLPTDFEEDSISLSVRVGGGLLEAPKDMPGLADFAGDTFGPGGLGAHSADDLRRILAGRSVGVGFSVGDDAFTLSGGADAEDLGLQLRLMCAQLSDPGFRPEGERLFRQSLDALYGSVLHTAEGAMGAKLPGYLHGGDPRFGLPDQEVMASRSTEEAKAWLTPVLQGGYCELAMVGDFDLAEAEALVAATFGALPERAAEKPAFAAARAINFPEPGESFAITFQSDIPKAIAAGYWKTDDMWDIGRSRRLSTLGSIFGDRLRLKVREELGDAYSPGAYHAPSDTFEGYGYIAAMVTIAPEKAEAIADILLEISEDIRLNGVGEDELERAREPILTSIRQRQRSNGYWLSSVLGGCHEYPQRLKWARFFLDDYASVTTEELTALAAEYLGADRGFIVSVLQEEGGEAAE